MNTSIRSFAAIVTAIMAGAALGDSITLRGSVRMPATGGPLLLEDVATLQGVDAQRFATLEIHPGGGIHEAIEINVDTIEELLAEEGVNWAKVALNGGAVVVRPRVTSNMAIGMSAFSGHAEPVKSELTELLKVGGGASIETTRFRSINEWEGNDQLINRIVETVKTEWGEDAKNLYLAIDIARLKELPRDATQISVVPRGSSRGTDWFDVQFRAVRGSSSFRPTKTVLVRVDLRIMSDSVIAERQLAVRRTLKLSDLSISPRLLKPTDALRSLELRSLVGRRLAKPVLVGDPVLSSALEPEIVIRRNDSVHVVMQGPFKLSGSEALALERGAVGERINCRWRAGDESFTALVVGPGEVRAGG